jgi:aquaporin Z
MYAVLVEYLGTLLLVGTIAFTGNPALIVAALAIGIGFGGKISGGHFNPAVSTWAWLAGKLPSMTTLHYVLAQFAAAVTIWVLHSLRID